MVIETICHPERNEVKSKDPFLIKSGFFDYGLTPFAQNDSEKKPLPGRAAAFLQKGQKRREVEKELKDMGGCPRLSVCIIPGVFERPIKKIKTFCDHFVNKKYTYVGATIGRPLLQIGYAQTDER